MQGAPVSEPARFKIDATNEPGWCPALRFGEYL